MKKQLLLVGTMLILSCASVFAQYSGWSIQAKGGVNSMKAPYPSFLDRDYNPAFGGVLEYTFTPTFGIGAEFYSMNNDHADFNYSSQIQQAILFSSFNISNLTMKYRQGKWANFNIYVNVGGGLGFGKWSGTGVKAGSSDDVTNLAYSFGSNLEYDLNRSLAIGLEGTYRWFSNGYYNTPELYHSKGIYNANLTLRYKIPCKAKTHIRNVSIFQYDYAFTPKNTNVVNELQIQIDSLKQEVAALAAQPKVITQYVTVKDTLLVKKAEADSSKMDEGKMYNGTPKASLPSEEIAVDETEPVGNVQMRTEAYVNASLKRYSVVVGSFMNKANADALVVNLQGKGLDTQVVQNEQGMNRVVVFSSNSLGAAIGKAKQMRSKYPSAWVLILK